MRRRLTMLVAILLILVLGLVIAWFTGGATRGLLYVAEHHLLPYRTGNEFTLTRVYHQVADLPAPDDRVRVTISRERVRQALHEAGGWDRYLPPGFLRDGLVIAGGWTPYSRGQNVGITIPVEMAIAATDGDHPHLTGTLPVAMLNAYMNVEFADDFVTEGEEYFLGTYDYSFHPTIGEATLRTTNSPSLPPAAYAERIGLDVQAWGTVKLKFEENLFRTSTTAQIHELHLEISAFTRPTDEGRVLDYVAKFKALRGNVRKLHNYGDKKVSEKLNRKWTRSLNKEKRRRKLARHSIPPWAPLDLVIDLHFYPEAVEPVHDPVHDPVPR